MCDVVRAFQSGEPDLPPRQARAVQRLPEFAFLGSQICQPLQLRPERIDVLLYHLTALGGIFCITAERGGVHTAHALSNRNGSHLVGMQEANLAFKVVEGAQTSTEFRFHELSDLSSDELELVIGLLMHPRLFECLALVSLQPRYHPLEAAHLLLNASYLFIFDCDNLLQLRLQSLKMLRFQQLLMLYLLFVSSLYLCYDLLVRSLSLRLGSRLRLLGRFSSDR
mmetsp:Transcript_31554/g.100932  ORF Transcript_31554/g.100932 Transcript_31554/m.100932 type:complete len:224 (+) Transcript_31554:124-795(+)